MGDEYKTITKVKSASKFTEITKKNRDKVAEIIENRYKELWLAPTIKGYVYGTTRALDFGDYYGELGKKFGNGLNDWEWAVNRNADLFEYTQLVEPDEMGIPRYLSFRKANLHVNHNSHDPQLAIGLVFDSTLVMDKYGDTHVVILFGVDRMKAANIARTLETYPERIYTSMGCSIKSSMCTACGKKIMKDTDFCDCLKHHRGSRVKGKKAAELLQKMAFYEQSVVTTPACPNAVVLDAVAEIVPGRILKVASELGEDENMVLRIMSNIHQAIKSAGSIHEKKRLANQLDALIYKLETMVEAESL